MAIDRNLLNAQIDETTAEIDAAMWTDPANIERVKVLISKRMGLRILLGEVKVKLKPPPVFVEFDAPAELASMPLAA